MSACGINEELNIYELIEKESIITFFQPIVSVTKHKIMGFEALTQGVHPETDAVITPTQLFYLAGQEDVRLELDRLCRRKALEAFAEIRKKDPSWFVSINFDTSLLDQGVGGSGHIYKTAVNYGIDPNRVIIEVVESQVNDLASLKRFVDYNRARGFLIALDDFGAGYSNMQRISTIKPNILKVDRSILNNLDKEYYKQEILRSLINLSHKLGALVIAEGVERQQETMVALEMDADFLQGYYFSSPYQIDPQQLGFCQYTINTVAEVFKQKRMSAIQETLSVRHEYSVLIKNMFEVLKKTAENRFDDVLTEGINEHPLIECCFVLDQYGIQASSTILETDFDESQRNIIFKPAEKGADLSIKEYYLRASMKQDEHITEPYISNATGNLCVTIVRPFVNRDGKACFLCVDIKQS